MCVCLCYFQARLHAIQLDPGTYLNESVDDDDYIEWMKTFSIEESKGAISDLLVENSEVRGIYTQLVSSRRVSFFNPLNLTSVFSLEFSSLSVVD